MSAIKVLKVFHSHNFFNRFLIPNSRWIKACIELETDDFKKSLMQQYLDMIYFALPAVKDILDLKRLVAGNLDDAFSMYTSNEKKMLILKMQ